YIGAARYARGTRERNARSELERHLTSRTESSRGLLLERLHRDCFQVLGNIGNERTGRGDVVLEHAPHENSLLVTREEARCSDRLPQNDPCGVDIGPSIEWPPVQLFG